eukprot:4328316-Amphidinium_carterae.1
MSILALWLLWDFTKLDSSTDDYRLSSKLDSSTPSTVLDCMELKSGACPVVAGHHDGYVVYLKLRVAKQTTNDAFPMVGRVEPSYAHCKWLSLQIP